MSTATAPAKSGGQKVWAYEARNRTGKLVKGVLDVPSEGAAVAKLSTMGLSPVKLAEKRAGTGLNAEINIAFLQKGIRVTDLAVAARQLATMTASGLALLRALTVVADQTQHPKLRTILQEVAREVETGGSFSDALERHRDIPMIMVSMIRAGETGGFLDTALSSVATTFEKEAKLRATIKSAMTYPIAVLVIAVLAVIGMLLFIVPIFQKMFEGLGSQLPAPTAFLVFLSGQMVWVVPVLIVAVVGGSVVWKRVKDRDEVRRIVHPLMLKVPVFGPLLLKVAIARFTRNLSNMTQAGVPLLKALTIVGQTSGNWVLEQIAGRVGESIRIGGSMAGPLELEKVFPSMVVQMIAVGEESGSVDVMLGKVADFYDTEIEATAESLTSLIEPILIVVLGGVVGGMVIALYMPIFNIANAVK